MRQILLLFIVTAFSLSGCGIGATQIATTTTIQGETPSGSNEGSLKFSFSTQNMLLSGEYPLGWESYTTEYGIVLAEELGTVASDGRLNGLLVHILVPPMDDFKTIASSENRAWDILHAVIHNPEYVGAAAVSEPIAFQWGEHKAAYYLMDSGEGHLTIVIGVIIADADQLVVCHTSAPSEQAERIRQQLPQLLDDFMINDIKLDGVMLDAILPSKLVYPQFQ